MKSRRTKSKSVKTKAFPTEPSHYVLQLYVAGQSPRSVRAVANIKRICEEYLHGRFVLDVIDLYQQPKLAHDQQILAVPMLVRKEPLPVRRIIGDLSNTERVLARLEVQARDEL